MIDFHLLQWLWNKIFMDASNSMNLKEEIGMNWIQGWWKTSFFKNSLWQVVIKGCDSNITRHNLVCCSVTCPKGKTNEPYLQWLWHPYIHSVSRIKHNVLRMCIFEYFMKWKGKDRSLKFPIMKLHEDWFPVFSTLI